ARSRRAEEGLRGGRAAEDAGRDDEAAGRHEPAAQATAIEECARADRERDLLTAVAAAIRRPRFRGRARSTHCRAAADADAGSPATAGRSAAADVGCDDAA